MSERKSVRDAEAVADLNVSRPGNPLNMTGRRPPALLLAMLLLAGLVSTTGFLQPRPWTQRPCALGIARAKGFGDDTSTVKKMRKQQEAARQQRIRKEVDADGSDLEVEPDAAGPSYSFDVAPDAAPTNTLNLSPEEAAALKRQELATRGPEDRESEILKSLGITDEDSPFAAKQEKVNPFDVDPNYDDPRNVLSFVPMEIQAFLESFFTFTTALTLTAFLAVGAAITVDAFYRSSKQPVPENIAGVLEFVEPKFTTIGLVFLASSVLLGNFKLAQLTNPVSAYEEEGEDTDAISILKDK